MNNPLCVLNITDLTAQVSLQQHSVRQATEAWEWARANKRKDLTDVLVNKNLMGPNVARKTNTLLHAAKNRTTVFQHRLEQREHTVKEVAATYEYILQNRQWDLLKIILSPTINDQVEHLDHVRSLYVAAQENQFDFFQHQWALMQSNKKSRLPHEAVVRLLAIGLEKSPCVVPIVWSAFKPIQDKKHFIARTASAVGRLDLLKSIHSKIVLPPEQHNDVFGLQLQQAAANGHLDIVEYLFPKIQTAGNQCLTKSLEWAALKGHGPVAAFLLQQPELKGELIYALGWALKGQDHCTIAATWNRLPPSHQTETRKRLLRHSPQDAALLESVLCKDLLRKELERETSASSVKRRI